MNTRTIHLKIKVKSLVAEAKIIRAEENKICKNPNKQTVDYYTYGSLRHYRKSVVRVHTRINLLAYGILRNTPYELIEKKCHEKPNFYKVKQIALRFGADEKQTENWTSAARDYLRNKTLNLAA